MLKNFFVLNAIVLIVLRIWNCSDLFDCMLSVSWMSIIYPYYNSYCILCMIAWISRWQQLQIVGVLFLYSMSILICEVSQYLFFLISLVFVHLNVLCEEIDRNAHDRWPLEFILSLCMPHSINAWWLPLSKKIVSHSLCRQCLIRFSDNVVNVCPTTLSVNYSWDGVKKYFYIWSRFSPTCVRLSWIWLT